jgi:hypothetical protein
VWLCELLLFPNSLPKNPGAAYTRANAVVSTIASPCLMERSPSHQIQLYMFSKNDRVEEARCLSIWLWVASGPGDVSHVDFTALLRSAIEITLQMSLGYTQRQDCTSRWTWLWAPTMGTNCPCLPTLHYRLQGTCGWLHHVSFKW